MNSTRTQRQFQLEQIQHAPAIARVKWTTLEKRFRDMLELLNTPMVGDRSSQGKNKKKNKYAQILPPMTEQSVVVGAEARKQHRDNVKMGLESVIDLCRRETVSLLSDGDFEEAIRGGLLTLKFIQELYGTISIEQIDVYFILAKASQYLNHYKEAQEFLSAVNWTIIKNQDCPVHFKAELQQNYGLLSAGMGRIEKSIEHLSTCVYYLALLHGTEHVITSFGYFNIGNVFASQGQVNKAIGFMIRVIDIWYRHLKSAFNQELEFVSNTHESRLTLGQNENETSDGETMDSDSQRHIAELESLDEEKIHQAPRMFEQILSVEIERFRENHVETGKTHLVHGLYLWWIGEMVKSQEALERSLTIFESEVGETSANAAEARSIIEKVTP